MTRFFEFTDANLTPAQRGELLFQRALLTDRYIQRRRAPYQRWRGFFRIGLFLPVLTATLYEMVFGVWNVHKLRGDDRLQALLKVRGDVSNFFPEMYLRQLEADHRRLTAAEKEELNVRHWR